MGVKICWRAAKSRNEKGGLKERKEWGEIPPRRLLSNAVRFSSLLHLRAKENKTKRGRKDWQIYEATGWYRNNVTQKGGNGRKWKKGRKDWVCQRIWGRKQAQRISDWLEAKRQKRTEEVRETEDGEVISHFLLAWYSSFTVTLQSTVRYTDAVYT